MSLHPNAFVAFETDTRRWAVLHKSESFGGAVSGGIFRAGIVTGLRTRQVRSLAAAMGGVLVGACSETGEEVLGTAPCPPERWRAFLAIARGIDDPVDAPAQTPPQPAPASAPAPAPEVAENPVTAPLRDAEGDGDGPAPGFEPATENDFLVETVQRSALESMTKAELEVWARERGVEAPANDFLKAQQIELIVAAGGDRYEVI